MLQRWSSAPLKTLGFITRTSTLMWVLCITKGIRASPWIVVLKPIRCLFSEFNSGGLCITKTKIKQAVLSAWVWSLPSIGLFRQVWTLGTSSHASLKKDYRSRISFFRRACASYFKPLFLSSKHPNFGNTKITSGGEFENYKKYLNLYYKIQIK